MRTTDRMKVTMAHLERVGLQPTYVSIALGATANQTRDEFVRLARQLEATELRHWGEGGLAYWGEPGQRANGGGVSIHFGDWWVEVAEEDRDAAVAQLRSEVLAVTV